MPHCIRQSRDGSLKADVPQMCLLFPLRAGGTTGKMEDGTVSWSQDVQFLQLQGQGAMVGAQAQAFRPSRR